MKTENKGHFKIMNSGKPKGAVAKTTKEAKELFVSIMQDEVENIKESLAIIRTKDHARYLEILSKLFPYYLPKMMDVDIKSSERIITVVPPSKRINP